MRTPSLCSAHMPAWHAAHAPPIAAAAACAHHAAFARQARGIKLPAWMQRGSRNSGDAETLEGEQAPEDLGSSVDPEVVDSIVDIAGPATMDAATWPTIHAGSWLNSYGVELLLQNIHDVSGLTWIAVIPLTTCVVRVFMLPLFIRLQRSMHKMAVMKPDMEALQVRLQKDQQRGMKQAEAVVRCLQIVVLAMLPCAAGAWTFVPHCLTRCSRICCVTSG